jgi:hypothetical protein
LDNDGSDRPGRVEYEVVAMGADVTASSCFKDLNKRLVAGRLDPVGHIDTSMGVKPTNSFLNSRTSWVSSKPAS